MSLSQVIPPNSTASNIPITPSFYLQFCHSSDELQTYISICLAVISLDSHVENPTLDLSHFPAKLLKPRILENGAKIHLVVENGHLGRHP